MGPGGDRIDDAGVAHAGGAVPLPVLARFAARAGRTGLEFFVGIPGSVGGAVRMNAGCHGSDTGSRLITARIVRRSIIQAPGNLPARDRARCGLV